MLKINSNIEKSKSIFSSKDLSIFCKQVSMLINSGIMLNDGIKIMADEASDIRIKKVLQCVSDELSKNSSLEDALSKANCFPEYMIYLTAIGTESGTLDKTMKSLSSYYDRQANIKETVKSAILYPSVLICMMVAVLLFLSIKVLPVFETMLNSLGTNLSTTAKLIMEIGKAFSKFSVIFAIIIVAIILCIIYFAKSDKGRSKLVDLMWQTKIFETLSISILSSSMSTSLASGLDTDRSLELSSSGIVNKNIEKKINECMNLIKNEHFTFIEAIGKSRLFTGTALNILSVGMSSGSLDGAMQYVSSLFDDDFEAMLVKRISLIEPISVAILSFLIGIILISVMFPLLGIMSVIGA